MEMEIEMTFDGCLKKVGHDQEEVCLEKFSSDEQQVNRESKKFLTVVTMVKQGDW